MTAKMPLSSAPVFDLPAAEVRRFPAPELPVGFLWEYLRDGRTPARALTDIMMRRYLAALEGRGEIIELGAGGDYYRAYAKDPKRYVTSNIVEGMDRVLDMTRLDIADNSADAFLSVFALEHIFDYEAALAEQYRALKPGGRMLLFVPFMYYYHAAPDDFFRFSASALDRLLARFDILLRQPLGGRWLLFAEFLHEKSEMGSRKSKLTRFGLRVLALPFLAAALKSHDPQYATCFAYICEKPREAGA